MLAGLQLDCSNPELLWPSTGGMHNASTNARTMEWESPGRSRVAFGVGLLEGMLSALHSIFLFGAGIMAVSFVLNLFLSNVPAQKES